MGNGRPGPSHLPYPQDVQQNRSNFRKVAGPGELALLRHIRSRAGSLSQKGLSLGIGDDCALLGLRPGEEVAVTTDLSIAGRHFRLDWHPAEAIGHRVLARGLSDLAAMGARPLAAFLSLGLPLELTKAGRKPAWVERFLDGLLALAESHMFPLAGGDLAESPLAVADIVLVGAVPRGKALLRSGARPGHLLYVTGALGGAAAGLAQLAELARQNRAGQSLVKGTGFSPYISAMESSGALAPEGTQPRLSQPPRIPKRLEALLAPHLYPQPRIAQGLWLQRRNLATAAIDLSDGLSTDLAHICEESGVDAEVEAASLPLHPGATLDQALNGGEDYELLFTAAPRTRIPRQIAGVSISKIGRIMKPRRGHPAVSLLTEDGPRALEPRGWEHFS